jgi:hypothetical protein
MRSGKAVRGGNVMEAIDHLPLATRVARSDSPELIALGSKLAQLGRGDVARVRRAPSDAAARTVIPPSFSVRVTRSCSHVSSRP